MKLLLVASASFYLVWVNVGNACKVLLGIRRSKTVSFLKIRGLYLSHNIAKGCAILNYLGFIICHQRYVTYFRWQDLKAFPVLDDMTYC